MSCYALFYNTATEDIELYPQMEEHTMTKEQIEDFLEKNPDALKWAVYDYLPGEEDIDNFEKLVHPDSEDEDE